MINRITGFNPDQKNMNFKAAIAIGNENKRFTMGQERTELLKDGFNVSSIIEMGPDKLGLIYQYPVNLDTDPFRADIVNGHNMAVALDKELKVAANLNKKEIKVQTDIFNQSGIVEKAKDIIKDL